MTTSSYGHLVEEVLAVEEVICNSTTYKRHLVQYCMMHYNPFTPMVSFHNSPYFHMGTIMMLVQRIWYWINLFHLITYLLDAVLIW